MNGVEMLLLILVPALAVVHRTVSSSELAKGICTPPRPWSLVQPPPTNGTADSAIQIAIAERRNPIEFSKIIYYEKGRE